MPELPEVEVVKRSLEKKILNLTIKKVEVNVNKLRYKVNKDKISELVGKKIRKITRRSKFLIFFPTNFEISKLLTLYLKLPSLIFTFFTVRFRMFFSKDLLTTSTSGNSGI